MSLTAFKFIAAFFILLTTVLGGLWPFLKKKEHLRVSDKTFDFPIGESFASGIFLGAGLLHMLPNAALTFVKAGYSYPFPFFIAASVFLLLLLLEHITISLQHHAHSPLSSTVLLTVLMLSIHSLFEGTAIGISSDFTSTVIILVAILAHKMAASFALAVHLNKINLRFRFFAFSFFALMTPIGIFASNAILLGHHHSILLTPIFSSLAAGTFLYIGTLHGLDRASLIKNCCNMREFFFMLLGFILMAVLAIWT